MKKNQFITILAGLGLAFGLGYLLFRKPKPQDENEEDKKDSGESKDTEDSSTNSQTTPVKITSNPFKTEKEVLDFQRWVLMRSAAPNIVGDKTLTPIYLGNSGVKKNGVDGKWGKNTAAAWDKWGYDYNIAMGKTISDSAKGYIDKIVKANPNFSKEGLKNLAIWYDNFPQKWSDKLGKPNFNNFLKRLSDSIDLRDTKTYLPDSSRNSWNCFSYGVSSMVVNGLVTKLPGREPLFLAKYANVIGQNVNISGYKFTAIAKKTKVYPYKEVSKTSVFSNKSFVLNDEIGELNGSFVTFYFNNKWDLFYRVNIPSLFGYYFLSAEDIQIKIQEDKFPYKTIATVEGARNIACPFLTWM